MLTLLLLACGAAWPDKVVVDKDDVAIAKSCTVVIGAAAIADANGDGVIHVTGDDVVLEFAGATLSGAPAGRDPDSFAGVGVRVTGKRVTLRNAKISGFKAAIHATRADGLVVEGCDVSGNWCQRLKSTEKAEDGADWLWPHKNDGNEWLESYGAGIYVEESAGITVRGCRARRGQNGLLMRKVVDSLVIDNDFSFLSGWGIGMFRCERDRVQNNSCDFCVRGYSHGVYARGQDSAGILFFEQNRDNVIAYNSATHSGDGFFGFCGLEALEGDVKTPRIGNNGNLIARNDFSFAPAIGIEMTFSFDNVFAENLLNGSNYGIWGGYSNDTIVFGNTIHDNELAGIAIEHGSGWLIQQNDFAGNKRAIELWWNENADLMSKPWAKVNNTASRNYRLIENSFRGDELAIDLRGGTENVVEALSVYTDVAERVRVDDKSKPVEQAGGQTDFAFDDPRLAKLARATRQAVGGRDRLAGRDKIIVTEWGPYDWEAPYLQRLSDRGVAHVYRLLGSIPLDSAAVVGEARVAIERDGPLTLVVVSPKADGAVARYTLTARTKSAELVRKGLLVGARWNVRVFPWTVDPREDADGWRAQAKDAVAFETGALSLPYQGGGASQLAGVPEAVAAAGLPADRFGTLADARLRLPAGKWRFEVISDDGVRLWVDDKLVVDDWTWHAPKTEAAVVEIDRAREVPIRIEHFEIDGYATLSLEIAPAE